MYDIDSLRLAYLPNGLEPNGNHYPDTNEDCHSRSDSINGSYFASPPVTNSTTLVNGKNHPTELLKDQYSPNKGQVTSSGRDDNSSGARFSNGNGVQVGPKESAVFQDGENGTKPRNSADPAGNGEAEWSEQYEPGVYITLVALQDGTRDLKRVRFR